MNIPYILIVLLCLTISAIDGVSSSNSTSPSLASTPDLREVFHRFIKEYKKNYVPGSSEYRYRFRVFKASPTS